MLAGEDLGRRHQRGLRAAFDRTQHRHQRDKGLAAADIALQEAHHAAGLRQIGADLGDRHALGAGQCKTEPGLDLGGEPAVACRDAAAAALAAGADQCDCELAGKDFVIGEALARRGQRHQIGLARRGVGLPQGLGPGRPLPPAHQAAVDPFREIRNALERCRGGALDDARSETRCQRVDRLDRLQPVEFVGTQYQIGVRHLRDAVVELDAAADDALGADRE